jgi:hypothetical protein
MFWRIISALGILFWAVMAGLLVRDTYFPEESRFAEVPPKFVLDLFLNHRETATTLLLYRNDDKLGHATLTIRKQHGPPDLPAVYDLQGSGLVDGQAFGATGSDLTWRMAGELDGGQEWRSMIFQTGWRPGEGPEGARDGIAATVMWKQGSGAAAFEVRKAGKVIMDTAKANSMLKGGGIPLGSLLGPSLSGGPGFAGSAQVKAREGTMTLAGKGRKCYVLQMQFMGLYDIKMLFTEAGELARVDLPQGFHLLEPTINGLGASLAP